jgi:hypothetical protein
MPLSTARPVTVETQMVENLWRNINVNCYSDRIKICSQALQRLLKFYKQYRNVWSASDIFLKAMAVG